MVCVVLPSSNSTRTSSIGDRKLQPGDFDALAGEPVRPGIDPSPLDEGIREFLDDGLLQLLDAVRQLQHERQAHACQHGRAPEDRKLAGRSLLELQIRGACLVRARRRQSGEQDEQRRRDVSGNAAHADHFVTAPAGAGAVDVCEDADATELSGGAGSSTV